MASRRSSTLGLALALLYALTGAASAQAPAAPEPVKTMIGSWEMSNAERDRTCVVVLRATTAGPGFALQWAPKCAEVFPFTARIAAWRIGARDAVEFLDAGGSVQIELTEVEGGLYEGERPGQGLVFLQSMASRAAEERTPAQLAGDWAFTGASGKQLCRVALATTAAGGDAMSLQVQPGCDAAIVRFAPVAWQYDRGQLVVTSKSGQAWRFEEVDALTWRRIPAGRQPLTLVRQ